MATFSDLFARLDPDPRVRGKKFEHVCKWFLTNDPYYSALFRHVWLWNEWTGRWSGTEAGIDLVAEDHDGHRWAIQCKVYAEDKPSNRLRSSSERSLSAPKTLVESAGPWNLR